MAGSELRDVEPLLDQIKRDTGIQLELRYIGTLEGAEQLTSGAEVDLAWFSHAKYLTLLDAVNSRVRGQEKIMLSPVILGVKESKARAWGWMDNPDITWSDIADKAAAGELRYAMTNPAASNSGFTALVGVASALANTGDALRVEDIDNEALKRFFAGQTLTAGSSGWLADAYVDNQNRLEGMINYESVLLDLNQGGKLREKLTLIYPKEGIITADYPLMLINADKREQYDKLVEYLRTPAIQQQLMETTLRRPVNSQVALSALFPQQLLLYCAARQPGLWREIRFTTFLFDQQAQTRYDPPMFPRPKAHHAFTQPSLPITLPEGGRPMNRRLFPVLTSLLLLALLLGACAAPAAAPAAPAAGDATETAADAADSAAAAGEPLKVLNFVNGSLGDKSFFDSAKRGIDRAVTELGIEADTIEASYDATQWEPALIDALANGDYDVLVLGTSNMVEYVQRIAPQYPDVRFIFYDDQVNYETCEGGCANVYSMLYKQNEGSYLAGVYAAAMTTQELDGMNPDAVIGSVGGQEIPIIIDFMVGYEQGARDTNPDIQVLRQFADSWNDPAKGKELTKAQYSQGADIVFQIAGGTGQGVFEAAVEDGKYAIGVDSDQALAVADADPAQAERILTSMLKNIDNSIVRALQLHIEGTLPYGEVENLGIAEGGVGLARNEFYDKNTPDSVKQLVDAAEAKVTSGEIVVETAFQ